MRLGGLCLVKKLYWDIPRLLKVLKMDGLMIVFLPENSEPVVGRVKMRFSEHLRGFSVIFGGEMTFFK